MSRGAKSGPRTENPNENRNEPEARQNMIRVLGMDPSFRNWGYAFAYVDPDATFEGAPEIHVERIELFTTSRSSKKQVRRNADDLRSAMELHGRMQDAVRSFDPQMVVSEIPSGSQSATASRGLGVAVGVLASLEKPLIQVMPQEVKLAFLGSKTASKADIIERAAELHPDAGWKRHRGKITNAMEHPADAIAAIYAGVRTEQFEQLLSLYRSFR